MMIVKQQNKQVRLTGKESNRLGVVLGELELSGAVNLGQLIDPQTKEIADFGAFRRLVESRAELYESLSILAKKIDERRSKSQNVGKVDADESDDDLEASELVLSQKKAQNLTRAQKLILGGFEALIRPHREALELVQHKIRSIFEVVERYLSKIGSDDHQQLHADLAREGVGKLLKVISRQSKGRYNSSAKAVNVVHSALQLINHKIRKMAKKEKMKFGMKFGDRNDLGESRGVREIPSDRKRAEVGENLAQNSQPKILSKEAKNGSDYPETTKKESKTALEGSNPPPTTPKSPQTDYSFLPPISQIGAESAPPRTTPLTSKLILAHKSVLVHETDFKTIQTLPTNLTHPDAIKVYLTHSERCTEANDLLRGPSNSRYLCYSQKNSYCYNRFNHVLGVKNSGLDVYSEEPELNCVLDIVFGSGFYFIYEFSAQTILRKNLGENQPTRWWSGKEIEKWDDGGGRCLRMSRNGAVLGVRRTGAELCFLEILAESGDPGRLSEFKNNPDEGAIDCFEMVGLDKAILVTQKGKIDFLQYSFNPDQETKILDSGQLEHVNLPRESYFYATISQDQAYLAIMSRETGIGPNLLTVLRIAQNSIEEAASLPLEVSGPDNYRSIAFTHQVDHYLFICGYSHFPRPSVCVYSFDVERRRLAVKGRHEIPKKNCLVYQMRRFGDEVYGLMRNGFIVKVGFKYAGEALK